MKKTHHRKVTLSLALNDRYTPLQRAIVTAVVYGIGDMASVAALFQPFSHEVVARSVQQLVKEDVLALQSAEKRLALSLPMAALHRAIAEINEHHQTALAELVNANQEPGDYQVGHSILNAMLAGQLGGALDARKMTAILKVSK